MKNKNSRLLFLLFPMVILVLLSSCNKTEYEPKNRYLVYHNTILLIPEPEGNEEFQQGEKLLREGELEEAYDAFESIYTESTDNLTTAYALNAMGLTKGMFSEYLLAEEYLSKSIKLLEEENPYESKIITLNQLVFYNEQKLISKGMPIIMDLRENLWDTMSEESIDKAVLNFHYNYFILQVNSGYAPEFFGIENYNEEEQDKYSNVVKKAYGTENPISIALDYTDHFYYFDPRARSMSRKIIRLRTYNDVPDDVFDDPTVQWSRSRLHILDEKGIRTHIDGVVGFVNTEHNDVALLPILRIIGSESFEDIDILNVIDYLLEINFDSTNYLHIDLYYLYMNGYIYMDETEEIFRYADLMMKAAEEVDVEGEKGALYAYTMLTAALTNKHVEGLSEEYITQSYYIFKKYHPEEFEIFGLDEILKKTFSEMTGLLQDDESYDKRYTAWYMEQMEYFDDYYSTS